MSRFPTSICGEAAGLSAVSVMRPRILSSATRSGACCRRDWPGRSSLGTIHLTQYTQADEGTGCGEVVILDNLGSHKGKSARNAIRAKGGHLPGALQTSIAKRLFNYLRKDCGNGRFIEGSRRTVFHEELASDKQRCRKENS